VRECDAPGGTAVLVTPNQLTSCAGNRTYFDPRLSISRRAERAAGAVNLSYAAGMNDVTKILSAIESGDQKAANELLPLVYQELRKLAAAKLSKEKPGQTIQPTVLVHEAYLRLVDKDQPQQWNGRGHFFGAAAEAMRRILVENARRKQAQRHGGQQRRVDLDEAAAAIENPVQDLLALDEALTRFEQQCPR
jgi:RNA polymerase sigma factor (TIGR02999 family)